MKDTVKTDEEAIKILKQWLNETMPENLDTGSIIDEIKCNCECGETHGFRAFYEGSENIAFVSVCPSCGNDDDYLLSDVLEII